MRIRHPIPASCALWLCSLVVPIAAGAQAAAPPVAVLLPNGHVQPSQEANERFRGCAGFVADAPTFVVDVPPSGERRALRVRSTTDTVLVVRSPRGRILCADDTIGNDPALYGPFVEGRWEIWVGSYHRVPADFELAWGNLEPAASGPRPATLPPPPTDAAFESTDALPPIGPSPLAGQVTSPPALPSSTVVGRGQAGGSIRAPFGSECPGFFPSAAQIEYRPSAAPATGTLLRVRSPEVDATMAVRDPSGHMHCSDDAFGTDPAIELPPVAGVYAVFVGTYYEGRSGAFELDVGPGVIPASSNSLDPEEMPPALDGPPTTPIPQEPQGELLGTIASGGPRPASELDASCVGFVPERPQVVWRNRRARTGRIRVYGRGADTTLAVRFPDGRWVCIDDAVGLDPAIEASMPAGSYRIFVGAFSAGASDRVGLYFQQE